MADDVTTTSSTDEEDETCTECGMRLNHYCPNCDDDVMAAFARRGRERGDGVRDVSGHCEGRED